MIVAATLGIGFAVLAEAGLSFLGGGVRPPTALRNYFACSTITGWKRNDGTASRPCLPPGGGISF